MLRSAAAFSSLEAVISSLLHVIEKDILQHGIGVFQKGFSVKREERFSLLVQHTGGAPFLAVADLVDLLLHRSPKGRVLATLAPKHILLHHRNVNHVEMVVIHVPAQLLGETAVALVGVHDGGDNKLLPAHDADGAAIGLREEFFGVVISAVLVEVPGVDVKDHLSEDLGVLAMAPVGDDLLIQQVVQNAFITSLRLLEMDVHKAPLRHDVRVGVGFVLAFIVAFPNSNAASPQGFFPDKGPVNAIVSCQRGFLLSSGPRASRKAATGASYTFFKVYDPL